MTEVSADWESCIDDKRRLPPLHQGERSTLRLGYDFTMDGPLFTAATSR